MKGEVAFPTPCVLGHEISGIVEEVGPGVTAVRPGDRVVAAFIMPCGTCRHCVRGRDELCETFFAYNRLRGTLYDGTTRLARADGTPIAMYSMAGLAEYSVVPATDVFPVPESIELASAAVLGCAVFTAYGAVAHAGAVRPRDRVAVVAVGGVGLNIVALARVFGAQQVIAVDVAAEKLEAALALGATDVVNAADGDPIAAVRELTGGPRRRRRVRGARTPADGPAGLQDGPRRRHRRRRRHRCRRGRGGDRDHAHGAPRDPHRRLLRCAYAHRYATCRRPRAGRCDRPRHPDQRACRPRGRRAHLPRAGPRRGPRARARDAVDRARRRRAPHAGGVLFAARRQERRAPCPRSAPFRTASTSPARTR